MSHFYAQIDSENIVVALSQLSGVICESHPLYKTVVPIREYDETLMPTQTDSELITHKYIEKDDDGYGLFEEVRSEIQSERVVGA